jgi:capsular polysaccharide biosynthesis protein
LDLKRYLQVAARRWWVVLLAVLVTGSATAWRVMPAPDVYESKATFVVRPNETLAGDEIRAIDTLIRGGSINATYASIARSRLIRDRALERMGPDTTASGLRARAEVVAGTNILSITSRNEDPQLAHDFLEAVSNETVSYVQNVDDAYRLEPLDPPSLPSLPVDDRAALTIALGIVLGLALGVGLAMLIEYLRSPTPGQEGRAPHDHGTGPDPFGGNTNGNGVATPSVTVAATSVTVEEPSRPSVAASGAAAVPSGAPAAAASEPREYFGGHVSHRDRLSNGEPMPAIVKDWNGVARVIRTFGTKR